MKRTVKVALPVSARDEIGDRLPSWVVPAWFGSRDEGLVACNDAEIGWLDLANTAEISELIQAATHMRWFNTMYTGLEAFPLRALQERGVTTTNGAGLNAITIAEYVVLGMLTIAKGYREVVRAQERRHWLDAAPGRRELAGSRALVIGYGAIGKCVADRLNAFEVAVTVVRRSASGDNGFLGPGQWRARLGEFDWIILAAPATEETTRMIGARELEAMKPSAVLLNVARGTLVDHDALAGALKDCRIAGAFLDVTDPEPLPGAHALWGLDNAHISMHLSGRSQTRMIERAVQRFLDNLERYATGSPLTHIVDLGRGY
jgi:phosphoglycerate dehydrogenase-like enzyme